jgi:hypothetical protein
MNQVQIQKRIDELEEELACLKEQMNHFVVGEEVYRTLDDGSIEYAYVLAPNNTSNSMIILMKGYAFPQNVYKGEWKSTDRIIGIIRDFIRKAAKTMEAEQNG